MSADSDATKAQAIATAVRRLFAWGQGQPPRVNTEAAETDEPPLHLDLPEEVHAGLAAVAATRGISAEQHALSLLEAVSLGANYLARKTGQTSEQVMVSEVQKALDGDTNN